MMEKYKIIKNSVPVNISDIPVLDFSEFRNLLLSLIKKSHRCSAYYGTANGNEVVRLTAVLADDISGNFKVFSTDVSEKFASLTPECPQLHYFEREIAEQFGVIPEGHPWLKPVRFHHSWDKSRDAWKRKHDTQIEPCVCDFYKVEGNEIHEVAVGPVHAGVIEPGHFRFQCVGEKVLNLEISLGYQHRGIELMLNGKPNNITPFIVETIAGDSSIANSIAYSQVVEGLSGANVPPASLTVRGIALELERLANHTGDLGALANDVAFLPTASFCGRIRGDYLNMTAFLCGNRFGRGLVRPGGVTQGFERGMAEKLRKWLDQVYRDTEGAISLLWKSPSVMGRFEDTGVISKEQCKSIGAVGVTARACGIEIDSRYNFPSGIYQFCHLPISVFNSGDVFARAFVRYLEIQRSKAFISEMLSTMPDGDIFTHCPKMCANSFCISVVEGWRGEIVHCVSTNSEGGFSRYKIVDPSFHNWTALSLALRNEEISNFPLCNKSFNLSYCGHDL